MKYLKVRITSLDGETLYEKDAEVSHVFEYFVRDLVSWLVQQREMVEGEHYSATVVPRYGETLSARPVQFVDAARANQKSLWIGLQFDEPALPGQPVRFFTVELRIHERSLIYRQDFQTKDISAYYVAFGIEQALLGLGVLKAGQFYKTLFFAHDDEHGQFDKEHIPKLEQQAADLIEFVSDAAETPRFSYRDPAIYGGVQQVGQPDHDDLRIYVQRQTLEWLHMEAKVSEEVELGGILVGNVYRMPQGGRFLVDVSDYIVSEGTISSMVELRYTFQSWQSATTQLREKFPGKRIVGWYHTHLVEMPVKSRDESAQSEGTTMFFSQHDVFLHSRFFPDEWYTALVLDPWGKNQFFQWKNGKIAPCPAYYLYEGVEVAS